MIRMKKPAKKQLYIFYPNPLDVLADSKVQLNIKDTALQINGLPQGTKLEGVACRTFDGSSLFYAIYMLAKPLRLRGDDEDDEFKTNKPELLIGREGHLKQANILNYTTYLGLNPNRTINYRLGGWRCMIWEGLTSYDIQDGKKYPLQEIVQCGRLTKQTTLKSIVINKGH